MRRPEQALQKAVTEYLGWVLPPDVPWTAIGHGGGGAARGAILKGMGVKPGWPDLHLIWRGRACYIELKAGQALSPAQKAVHASIVAAGGVVAICHSIDQVQDILDVWGVPTRDSERRSKPRDVPGAGSSSLRPQST